MPAQAMFMLNNSFVREWSSQMATKLLADSATDPQRLHRAFVRTLGRPPTDAEVDSAMKYLEQYTARHRQEETDDSESRTAAWQSYCQLLFCLNEFLFVD